jgi:hypothetical protein
VNLSDERPKASAQSEPAGDVSSPGDHRSEPQEKRVDPRAPIDEPASVKILHPATTSHERMDGRAVNLSRSGLKLRVPEPLLPGTVVQVRFLDRIALGEIRYCIPTGTEFYVGVRFQDVMEMP